MKTEYKNLAISVIFFVTSGDGDLQNHFILFYFYFFSFASKKTRARNLAVILKSKSTGKTVLDINNC
jgi:hypothetical protein